MQVVTVPDESMTVLEIKPENVFSFPEGIPAFESVKEFVILRNPEEAPFMWLQATGEQVFAFKLPLDQGPVLLLCPPLFETIFGGDLPHGHAHLAGSPPVGADQPGQIALGHGLVQASLG